MSAVEKAIRRYHYPIIDSTNKHAKRWIDFWCCDTVTVLTADEQTNSYGRMGRRWHTAVKKNLSFSYIYNVSNDRHLVNIAQGVSLAVLMALESCCGIIASLKWPNDIFLEGKKLAGVLVEIMRRRDGALIAIVGIGMNVNAAAEDIDSIGRPATSLLLATGRHQCREKLLTAIIHEMHQISTTLLRDGFSALRDKYLASLIHHNGDTLDIITPQGSLQGLFRGIMNDGALLLEKSDGDKVTIHTGDIC